MLRLPIKSQSEEWTEFLNSGTVGFVVQYISQGSYCIDGHKNKERHYELYEYFASL